MEIKKLIDKIDLSYPELVAAESEYKKGNIDGCMDELISHFTQRKSPNYLFDKADMNGFKDDAILEEAEEILNHNIFGHQFEDGIDWKFNPTAETSRDNEWSWTLYRHLPWQTLARAYVMTGDEKYTEEFISQLKGFAKAWPVDKFMNDPEHAKTYGFPGHAWRTIETGIRIYTTWLPCLAAFKNAKKWDKEGWVVFLELICNHADFITQNYSNHKSSSNWLTMESSSLLQLGIMFPEMKNSKVWLKEGYKRVMHEMKYSFDNDGVHMERTPIYHMVSSVAFLQAWQMCKLNNIPVPPYALPTLIKSAEFIMKIVKPDFTTPMIGDADRNNLLTRRADTSLYEGMNLTFNPMDLNEMRAYFQTMYDLTKREDFLYFATGRKEGSAPEMRNYSIIDSGIYIMRTGWEPEDSYYHVHGIQLERGERSTHSHNDQGHLELHIKGEDVLIDSGRYIYNSSCWKDWRHYFTGTNSHNTIYIDDHEMGTVPGTFRIRGARTYCHEFEENDKYSVIDISHNGYAFTEDPIFHRRKVIRLEGDVYIIDDQLTGLGLDKHDIRLYFNFAPGELTNEKGNDYTYISDSGREYSYFSIANENVESSVLKGSEDPIGGWVSYGYPNREPIPQLCLKSEGPVPVRFISVIAPKGVECKGVYDENKAEIELSGAQASKVIFSEETIQVK